MNIKYEQYDSSAKELSSIKTFTESADYLNRRRGFFNSSNWLHWLIVISVYGITGTLATLLSRIILNGALQMEGSLVSGPWGYRGVYLLVMPPLYSLILIAVGSAFGKHLYFRRRVVRMWGRLLPIKRLAKIGR